MLQYCGTLLKQNQSEHVSGSKNFFVEMTKRGEPPYQNCDLIMNAYTRPNKQFPIPAKCNWFKEYDSVQYPQPQITSNTFLVSPYDVGYKIKVEVTSLEEGQEGKISVIYGPIRISDTLRRSVEEQIASGIGKFVITIFKEEQKYIQNDIFLDIICKENLVKFTSEQRSTQINFTIENPRVDSLYNETTKILLNFKNFGDCQKICNIIGIQCYQDNLTIGLQFDTRANRDIFLLVYRYCQTKAHLEYTKILQIDDIKKYFTLDYSLELSTCKRELYLLLDKQKVQSEEKEYLKREIKRLEQEYNTLYSQNKKDQSFSFHQTQSQNILRESDKIDKNGLIKQQKSRLNIQYDLLQAQFIESQKKNELLQKENDELAKQQKIHFKNQKGLEEALSDNLKHKLRAEGLEREVQLIRQQIESVRLHERSLFEKKEECLKQEIEQLEETLDQNSVLIASLRTQINELHEKCENYQNQNIILETEIATYQETLSKMQEDNVYQQFNIPQKIPKTPKIPIVNLMDLDRRESLIIKEKGTINETYRDDLSSILLFDDNQEENIKKIKELNDQLDLISLELNDTQKRNSQMDELIASLTLELSKLRKEHLDEIHTNQQLSKNLEDSSSKLVLSNKISNEDLFKEVLQENQQLKEEISKLKANQVKINEQGLTLTEYKNNLRKVLGDLATLKIQNAKLEKSNIEIKKELSQNVHTTDKSLGFNGDRSTIKRNLDQIYVQIEQTKKENFQLKQENQQLNSILKERELNCRELLQKLKEANNTIKNLKQNNELYKELKQENEILLAEKLSLEKTVKGLFEEASIYQDIVEITPLRESMTFKLESQDFKDVRQSIKDLNSEKIKKQKYRQFSKYILDFILKTKTEQEQIKNSIQQFQKQQQQDKDALNKTYMKIQENPIQNQLFNLVFVNTVKSISTHIQNIFSQNQIEGSFEEIQSNSNQLEYCINTIDKNLEALNFQFNEKSKDYNKLLLKLENCNQMYQQIQQDLNKEKETVDFFSATINQLEEQKQNCQDSISKLNDKIDDLQHEIYQLKIQQDTHIILKNELEQSVKKLQEQRLEDQTYIDKLTESLQQKTQYIEEFEKNKKYLEEQILQLTEINQNIEGLKDNNLRQHSKVVNLQNEIQEKNKIIKQKESQIEHQLKEIEDWRKYKEEFDSKINELENIKIQNNEQNQILQQSIKKLETENHEQKLSKNSIEKEVAALKNELQIQEEYVVELQKQINTVTKDKLSFENQNNKIQKELENILEKKQKSQDNLKQTIKELEQQIEQLTSQLFQKSQIIDNQCQIYEELQNEIIILQNEKQQLKQLQSEQSDNITLLDMNNQQQQQIISLKDTISTLEFEHEKQLKSFKSLAEQNQELRSKFIAQKKQLELEKQNLLNELNLLKTQSQNKQTTINEQKSIQQEIFQQIQNIYLNEKEQEINGIEEKQSFQILIQNLEDKCNSLQQQNDGLIQLQIQNSNEINLLNQIILESQSNKLDQEEQNKQLRKIIEEVKDKNNLLQNQKSSLEIEIDSLKQRSNHFSEDNIIIKLQQDILQKDNLIQELKNKLENSSSNLQQQCNKLESENNYLNCKIQSVEQNSIIICQENAKLKAQLTQYKIQIENFKKEQAANENNYNLTIKDLQSKIEKFEQQNKTLESQRDIIINELNKQIMDIKQKYSEKNRENDQLIKNLRETMLSKDKIMNQVFELEQKLSEANHTLQKQSSYQNEILDNLKKQNERLIKENFRILETKSKNLIMISQDSLNSSKIDIENENIFLKERIRELQLELEASNFEKGKILLQKSKLTQ